MRAQDFTTNKKRAEGRHTRAMFLARRQALGRPFILRVRKVVSKGPSVKPTITIAENNRKLKAYQTLVHTRKLWEDSTNEDNKNAFKRVQPLRDIKEEKLKGDLWTMHDVEVPERHLSKGTTSALCT